MNCDVYMIIGEESIRIASQIDSSSIPSEINQDFINLLKSFLENESSDFLLKDSDKNKDTNFKYQKKLNSIKDKLQEVLLQGVTDKQIEGQDKNTFGTYQIANSNAKEVFDSCPPQIQSIFPSNLNLKKIKVRLVDKFESYGSNIIVKKSTNGENIYLLDGSLATFRKFARHLAIENAVNNQVLDKLDENSKEFKIIDKVLEKAKVKYKKSVSDRKSLLVHFIKNKSSYNNISITTEKGTYTALSLLDDIIPKIEHIYYPKNNNYSSPLVENIYNGMSFSNGNPIITVQKLYNILNGNIKISKIFSSQSEFNLEMNSKNKSEKVLKLFQDLGVQVDEKNEEDNYSLLFNIIFNQERGFPYKYRINKNGNLLFRSTYYEAKETYGVTFDTITLMDTYSYRGWEIKKNSNKEYFISQYRMLPTTYGQSYHSIKEAKEAIDARINNQTFRSSFLFDLFVEMPRINKYTKLTISKDFDTLQKGNIIKIPRISLPKNISSPNPKENILRGNYTLEEFKELIKTWPSDVQDILIQGRTQAVLNMKVLNEVRNKEIKQQVSDDKGHLLPNALQLIMDSEDIPMGIKNKLIIYDELIPELNNVTNAGLFLALLNSKYGGQTKTKEMVNEVLSDLQEGIENPLYFYVEDVKNVYSDNKLLVSKEVKLTKIRKDPTITVEYQQSKGYQYPIIEFWEETAGVLNEIFGTKINILTQSEIEDQFGEKYAKEKAFIKGDEVYINSTLGSTEDLFHEYIHIIMGYLKINNQEAYGQLLNNVWKATSPGKKANILKLYRGESRITQLEENFVKRFAEHIYKKGNSAFKETFESDIISESFQTIFDQAPFTLTKAGDMTVDEIFSQFSSEIAMALKNNNKLFTGFASSEQFKLENKKSNLIKKWIGEGVLQEFNCK